MLAIRVGVTDSISLVPTSDFVQRVSKHWDPIQMPTFTSWRDGVEWATSRRLIGPQWFAGGSGELDVGFPLELTDSWLTLQLVSPQAELVEIESTRIDSLIAFTFASRYMATLELLLAEAPNAD